MQPDRKDFALASGSTIFATAKYLITIPMQTLAIQRAARKTEGPVAWET